MTAGEFAAQMAAPEIDGGLVDAAEFSLDAGMSIDLGGVITGWNGAAEDLYGFAAADIVGQHYIVLIPADLRARETDRFLRVAAGERIELFGVEHLHRSGAAIAVVQSLTPITNDDAASVTGVASASREIGDLALAQGRSQQVMDAATSAMLAVDADGAITLVSDPVEALFGYRRSELIGQPVEMLIPTLERIIDEALLQGFVPDHTGRPIGGPELIAVSKNGALFPVTVGLSGSDIDTHRVVTLTVEDAHNRVAADAGRRGSQARAREVAASTDVAFVLRSLNPPAFLYVSPGYRTIFGYDPIKDQQDPECSLREIHPQDLQRFRVDYWNRCQVGLAARAEYRIIRRDGEVRWIRSMTWPIVDAGTTARRTASTVEDITDRRLADAVLRTAHAQAEKARAAKDEFLSRTSHELRTPLNAVLGFAQLLEMDALSFDQRDSVTHILRGGRHLLSLIDDVLDIAMIESDRLDLSVEAVPIADLISETVALMSPLAQTADISLHFQAAVLAGQFVVADNRRLRQVLLNLLSNAIKYNRRGGRVDIICTVEADEQMTIRVSDTGRGMRSQDLPRLFTPFDRLGAQATGIEGTGVGLALSHRLMIKMGGTLAAESRVGVGSTFTMCIPLGAGGPALPPVLIGGPYRARPTPADTPTRTLLYIEDNTSNIQLMEQIVGFRPQWRLTVAGHAALGLELAATIAPDLVLLDLHLPDMDGIDVLQKLLADPRTSRTPIVVVSADANPHQISRLLATGAQQYLTKPLDVAQVFHLLDDPAPPAGRRAVNRA